MKKVGSHTNRVKNWTAVECTYYTLVSPVCVQLIGMSNLLRMLVTTVKPLVYVNDWFRMMDIIVSLSAIVALALASFTQSRCCLLYD